MGGAPHSLTRAEQDTAIRRVREEWAPEDREWLTRLRGQELELALSVSALLHGVPIHDPPAVGDPLVIELP